MAKSNNAKRTQVPVSEHPLFPAIVALWFAALLGIGSLVLPTALFERISTVTRLAEVFPSAAPPLGLTARLLIAVGAAVIGATMGLSLARRIVFSAKPKRTAAKQAHARKSLNVAASETARRPISAKEELGSAALDTPAYEADGAYGAPSPIAGRRRSLALAEEERTSDFLQTAPLPGGELDFGQIAAAVTATISMESLPRERKVEPLELNTLAPIENDGAQPEQGNEAFAVADLAPAGAAPFMPVERDEPLELPIAFAEPETEPQMFRGPDNTEDAPEDTVELALDVSSPPEGAQLFRPMNEAVAEAPAPFEAHDPVGEDTPLGSNAGLRFAPPAEAAPVDKAVAIPAPFADPVAAAMAEHDADDDLLDAEPLVFAAPSLARMRAEEEPVAVAPPIFAPPPAIEDVEAAPVEVEPEEHVTAAEPEEAAPAIAQDVGLAGLGMVELAERLQDTLKRKLTGGSASAALRTAGFAREAFTETQKPAPSAEPAFAGPAASFASPRMPETDPASTVDAAARPAASLPLAMRPVETDFDDESDADSGDFQLPIGPGFHASDPSAMDDDNEAYSSLLDMRSPFRPQDEFVRIEMPEEDAAAGQPAVVFPHQSSLQMALDNAQGGGSRAFDKPLHPLGSVEELQPRKTADPAEAERALRAALSTLQRVSGAA